MRAAAWSRGRIPALLLTFALAVGVRSAGAQSAYPDIPVWAKAGAWPPPTSWQDGCRSVECAFPGTLIDRPRSVTVRWLRDPVAEARPDFGGYRIYRATTFADTTTMVLLRRFSKQLDDGYFTWHFPPITTATPELQRIATFVDPDSAGRFIKVCRLRRPQEDPNGACLSLRDSVMILVPPPGPHDGFRTWYSITYEALNTTSNDYLDAFVPDTGDNLARCPTPDTSSCPNLNHKAANVANDVGQPRNASADPDSHFFAHPVEPTAGPRENLALVAAVPNPYRASEAWNPGGGHELHFINLPAKAKIRIYTLAGDLVAELDHTDQDRDFARWDLKNGAGRDVTSGIYIYRVEAGSFAHQSRFIVIR